MNQEKSIEYKGVKVVYDDIGAGSCFVLVHGYLETRQIWDDFADRLSSTFRVITIDLPGHGASGTWGKKHTMDDLARSIRAIIVSEGIEKIFLVGHSMGGYVTMAFADLFPESLKGYCLFHSTCFADTEEKKKNRDREISLVLCKRKKQIINVNIPKGFADDNQERMKEEIDRVRKLALMNKEDGIVAILNGMKERPDRTNVLRKSSLPLLLIGGMKDNYIPVEVFEKLVTIAPHAKILRLQNSGHSGFLEEPDASEDALVRMLK